MYINIYICIYAFVYQAEQYGDDCTYDWTRVVERIEQQLRFLQEEDSYRPKHGWEFSYGVASISRLFKIIGLFCKRAL